MVNHSRKAFNCRMKRVLSNGQPHLCLFATKDIGKNQQLLYDYGVPDTELPWVKVSSHYVTLSCYTCSFDTVVLLVTVLSFHVVLI